MAIVLPARSASEVIPLSGRTASASALPITSKIHGTLYSIPDEIPRDAGLDPTRPMSTPPASTASLTEPPESNSFHSTVTSSPNACSSRPSCLTIRSPLGTFW